MSSEQWLCIISCACCFPVTKSCPTLRSHGLQRAGFLCSPPSPGDRSHSCPLTRRCYLAISSSVHPSPLPSIFPSIRVFSLHQVVKVFSISPCSEYSGTVHGVLQTGILEWVTISSSSGSCFVRTLHYDHTSWVALHGMTHITWVMQAPSPQLGCDPWLCAKTGLTVEKGQQQQ